MRGSFFVWFFLIGASGVIISDASAGDLPVGLTLVELQAIRTTKENVPTWFPEPFSNSLRKLLVESTNDEVVQIIIYPDGEIRKRGHSILFLDKPAGVSASRDDYISLQNALDSDMYKSYLPLAEARLARSYVSNPTYFAATLGEWNGKMRSMTKTIESRERVETTLGSILLELPDSVRTTVLKDTKYGNALTTVYKGAKEKEKAKVDAIKNSSSHALSQEVDVKHVATHLIKVFDKDHPQAGLHLTPVIGEKDLFVYEIEPGKRIYVKTDPETMKKMQSKNDPAAIGGLLSQGKVALFVTQQSNNAVTRVDGKSLTKTIQTIGKKK